MKKKVFAVLVLALLTVMVVDCQQTATPTTDFQPLKILYPRGGETFNPGDTLKISWSHSTAVIGKTVKLNISLLGDDGVGSYTKVIQDITTNLSVSVSNLGPSRGEWGWTIPPNPGKYVIRIGETDESGIHYIDTTKPFKSALK